MALHNGATNAKCDPDLTAAARIVANKLVAAAGGIGGGAAGAAAVTKSGGIARIGNGLRDIIAYAKTRVGGGGKAFLEINLGGAKNVGEAYNVANASKLAEQLRRKSANSPFTVSGTLTQEAINNANPIRGLEAGTLSNPNIPAGFGKYTTDVFRSPAGDFQVHFYKNPTTGEVFYGLDYKAVFNNMSGVPK